MKKLAAYVVLFAAGIGIAAALHGGKKDAVGSVVAELGTLKRGLIAGGAVFLTGGIPSCGGDFATYYVREAVDGSALSTSNNRVHSAGVTEVSDLGLTKSRSCRGKVTFANGDAIPVTYTITPQGFHNYIVKTTAVLTNARPY